MNLEELTNEIGEIDIYLLDQILKKQYASDTVILDAGCGKGRNLKWFYKNNYSIYGIDHSESNIISVKEKYPQQANHFSVQNLDALNFEDATFDRIICNAVLHFAQNTQHFFKMFSELARVLKPGGSIFIRMTTINGMENFAKPIGDGVYYLPDGTNRFLLTDDLLKDIITNYNLKLAVPKKYVNVNNLRCMATLIFSKI